MIVAIFHNYVFIAALIAWGIAQTIKVPIEYLRTHKWNWALLIQAGGMPSSHSALVVGVAHGIGLSVGFDSALFALAFAVCMVVIYDATGIRRQAWKHAERINAMISDLAAGHPLKQDQLAEVLGHTPAEALGGIILGLLVAQLTWIFWAK
ncbi:MAG: divergent PAP2 family protein [Anaerolineae bacterium]|nr:divergent PAP2 family protein [Anaerolineae bacterium]